ncbi:MAG: hypothetical protein F6K65_33355, partial [Moorea sp. SIO3C2]|nr:hypothetical protein [Moorena sp. SIO3C2]
TLVQSQSGDLNVQIRYVQIDPRATVASAVATMVDGQRVVIDSEGIQFDENGIPFVTRRTSGSAPSITIDGVEVNTEDSELATTGQLDIGNSRIYRRGGEYTIVFAGENGTLEDGDDQLVVNYFRPGTLNIVSLYLGDEKKGQIEGLLGNLNDNPDDDVALPDGTPLERPLRFTELYGDYREAWRIKEASESLFDYEPGQSPDTFYNPHFPIVHVGFNDLDPSAQALGEAAALAAGYTPGTFEFFSAAFDFAITNDPAFLEGNTEPQVTTPLSIVNDAPLPITPSANFIGAEIELEYLFPNLDATPIENSIATVGDGVEFNRASGPLNNGRFQPGHSIDFSENSILYTAVQAPVSRPRFINANFNGYVFTDISDTLPAIENVTIDWSETTFRLSTSDVTFTENSIAINFEGLSSRPGYTAKLDVTFASEDDAYEENDDLLGAYDLSNNANTWLSDLSGEGIATDEDWYKLAVTSNNQRLIVDLQFTHTNGDLNLSLYDENANFILGSSSLTDNEQIDTVLAESGTYYLKVDPVGIPNEANTYDLRWNV